MVDLTDSDICNVIKAERAEAVKAERERCAKIAEAIDSGRGNEKEIARAIRVRSCHRAELNGRDIVQEYAAEIVRLCTALEIIAGRRQCVDNLMSNAEVAAAALDGR